MFQHWNYPGPDNEESWPQAWLLAQLQALERADLVVALGGKVSKSANTLLHLAEAKGIPIVPFAFLGGAAERAFARQDWERIAPNVDMTVFQRDIGIDQTINIANRLLLERVGRTFKSNQAPHTVFVSVAKNDSGAGKTVIGFLKSQGLEVLTGENQTRHDQMVAASIQQALLKSDVCLVLWSQSYALSPWCYDELAIAIRRQSVGSMRIWLFNLEITPRWCQPKRGSCHPSWCENSIEIVDALRRLLSMSGDTHGDWVANDGKS